MTVTVVSENNRVLELSEYKGFYTTYVPGWQTGRDNIHSVKYGTYVLASSLEKAEKLLKQRNLPQEKIRKPEEGVLTFYKENTILPRLSELPFSEMSNKVIDKIHLVTFLGFVGNCAGKFSSKYLLSDIGLVHECIHIFDDIENKRNIGESTKEYFYQMLRSLEAGTIGLYPKRRNKK